MERRVIEQDFGDLALNMGPQHPSTHGVFRLKLHLEGEKINKVESFLGYLHRGVEKLTEKLDYDMIPPVLERDDYLSPTSNSLGFINTVESMCDIEVPDRASYIRILVAEFQRISSHLVALGTYGLDLGGALGGGASLFLYCFREREKILDFMEALTGTRFHTNINQVGGIRYDLNDSTIKQANDLISFDLRKDSPYEKYSELEFIVPIGQIGDAYDRTMVRMKETIQSLNICEQVLDKLPQGPISSRKPIKSAKLLKPPKGSHYKAVESPRGELGFFIVSDGTSIPYRMKIRAPSFSNLSIVEKLLPDTYIADAVVILGSLDPVFGDVDR